MEKLTLKEKAERALIVSSAFASLSLAIGATGLVLDAVGKGIQYLAERTLSSRSNLVSYNGKLEQTTQLMLLGTHGVLNGANIEVNNGTRISITDGASLVDGKYFENTIIGRLEAGKNYEFKVREYDLPFGKLRTALEIN